jgi:2-polyprenyl-6-methoxyphenol hydroxylase-like FAD-dependent oxidoreductase
MRSYVLPGNIVPLKTFHMTPVVDPTPDRPFVSLGFNLSSAPSDLQLLQVELLTLGQDILEGVLRAALKETYSCEVEFGTQLVSFTQDAGGVDAVIVKGDAVPGQDDTQRFDFLVSADDARGIVRKHLGLSFLGESRPSVKFIIADVRVEGIDEDVSSHFYRLSLVQPTLCTLVALASMGRPEGRQVFQTLLPFIAGL